MGTLSILMLTVVSYYYGCDRVFKQLFYLFMCRKLLTCIIKVRSGKTVDKVIEDTIERNLGQQDVFDDLEDKSQRKIMTLNDMLENQEKPEDIKIDGINKILYEKCFGNDQYQNDEEKVEYEESIKQMVQTIKILQKDKVSTPWVNYKRDFTLAFGPKRNLHSTKEKELQAEKAES